MRFGDSRASRGSRGTGHSASLPRVVFIERDGPLGGGQLALRRYFESASRFERVLVALDDGVMRRWAEESGVRSILIGDGPQLVPRFLWHLFALRRAIRATGADLVVANGNYPGVLLALIPGRVPRVFYCRDLWKSRVVRVGRLLPLSRRWILGRFRLMLVNSEFAGERLRPDLRSDCHLRVVYTTSGVKDSGCVSTGSRCSGSAIEDDASGALRILSLSRHDRWKGLEVLIDAARMLNEDVSTRKVHVTIAGDGDAEYSASLRAFAERVGAPVEFVGRLASVDDALASHSVLVLASTDPEPFGQVLVQALAAGLVVVASDHGGPREILGESGAGILVPPGDADALASALREIRDNPQVARDLSVRSPAVARQFSDERVIELLESALSEFVGLSKTEACVVG